MGPGRAALSAALRISYVAVLWSIVTGTAAVVIGVQSNSTALVGTGTDVIADMVSSVVLVWRFRAELHEGRPGHEVERRAHLVASIALLVVAAGVTAASIAHLAAGRGASPTAAGLIVAALSLVVLPVLAVIKIRVAVRVRSSALRTDGLITLVGASTAALSLIGLLTTEALDWTAADPVAALCIAVLAAITGARELHSRGQ